MIFTLINVDVVESDGKVSGCTTQDHIGTLESATQRAIDIESVNSNAIDIAVVPNTMSCMPFTYHYRQTRLDQKRIFNANG